MLKRQLVFVILMIPILVWAAPSMVRKSAVVHGKALVKAKKSTVAVLVFPYEDGKVSSGSAMLSEQMGADLSGMKSVRVADRKTVRKKLFESTVVETRTPDSETIKKMGTVLGVDAVVTGTMKDLGKQEVELATELHRTDSGKKISSSKTTVKKTWADDPKFPDPAVP